MHKLDMLGAIVGTILIAFLSLPDHAYVALFFSYLSGIFTSDLFFRWLEKK